VAPYLSDPLFYATAIPAVIFLGLAKGGLSGVGTAATPLMALYLPPLEAAALLLPILLTQDAISVYVYRREWSAETLKIMLPGGLLGILLGWLFAAYVSDDAIRILIGVVALAFVLNVWLRRAPVQPRPQQPARGVFWAAVSGFASFASQGGSPPYQVYMLPLQLPKMVFVGTTTIFFACVNLMKVIPYMALAQFSAPNILTSVMLLPVAVVANFVGIWLIRAMPTKLFYQITYVLLFILGSVMLWQGVSHLVR